MADSSSTAEVTKHDQECICNFAIFADELRVIKQEIKRLDEYKVLLSDAQDEAMLAHASADDATGGDATFFRLGDCFLRMTEEQFEEKIASEEKLTDDKLEQAKQRLGETHSSMLALKSELYSKFKDQISLEFE